MEGHIAAYGIHSEDGLVMVSLSGRLDYGTIDALLVELEGMATAALPGELKILIDETDARAGLLGAAEIGKWINRWRGATALKQGKIAVIAPSLVMFGLNRMAAGVAGSDSEGHLDVFRTREGALEWLAV